MSVDKIFNVVGSPKKLLGFIEYIELLGYKNLHSIRCPFYGIVRIDAENKNYHNQFVLLSYKTLDVEKDAEKIDRLLTEHNKNLTEARDEFCKAVEEAENAIGLANLGYKNIEVNEPEEIKDTGEELVFKNNKTLGNSQVIKDIFGREWIRDTTLDTKVWGPWSRGYSVKVTEPTIKEHETLDQILSGNSPKPKLGVKHNQGKLPIDTVLTKQFPKAVEALVQCSVYGHEKYNKNGEDEDWLNFKRVEGGSQTYADAAARHNQNKSEKDEESGLYHLYHKLWNVMAEVELWEEENHKE